MSSPALASICARNVRQAVQVFDALALPGVSADRLLGEVGLTRAELDDPENRIPYATLDSMLERAVELSGDGNLGLHMANLPVVDPDDMASAVIATSPNLYESSASGGAEHGAE